MAGPASNFDAEIKAGMKSTGAKSSTNSVPAEKAKKASGEFNSKPKPTTAKPASQAQAAMPPPPPQIDTGAAMQAAGQAHMDAIHAHINGLKGVR